MIVVSYDFVVFFCEFSLFMLFWLFCFKVLVHDKPHKTHVLINAKKHTPPDPSPPDAKMSLMNN